MTRAEIISDLRAEAERYESAAKQQERMAEWSGTISPATRSLKRAAVLRAAADLLAQDGAA